MNNHNNTRVTNNNYHGNNLKNNTNNNNNNNNKNNPITTTNNGPVTTRTLNNSIALTRDAASELAGLDTHEIQRKLEQTRREHSRLLAYTKIA
eukprot:UN10207